MTIPLGAVLMVAAVYAVFFIIFSIVDLYHLYRFGSAKFFGFAIALAYVAGTVLITAAAVTLLQGTDWAQPLIAFGSVDYAP